MSLLNFSVSQSVVYSDIKHNVPKLEDNSFYFVSYEQIKNEFFFIISLKK
jgi:hypothetical protein